MIHEKKQKQFKKEIQIGGVGKMLQEALLELAEEAANAGDTQVSGILYTLLGAMASEDIGALSMLAEVCQGFSKMMIARLQNE